MGKKKGAKPKKQAPPPPRKASTPSPAVPVVATAAAPSAANIAAAADASAAADVAAAAESSAKEPEVVSPIEEPSDIASKNDDTQEPEAEKVGEAAEEEKEVSPRLAPTEDEETPESKQIDRPSEESVPAQEVEKGEAVEGEPTPVEEHQTPAPAVDDLEVTKLHTEQSSLMFVEESVLLETVAEKPVADVSAPAEAAEQKPEEDVMEDAHAETVAAPEESAPAGQKSPTTHQEDMDARAEKSSVETPAEAPSAGDAVAVKADTSVVVIAEKKLSPAVKKLRLATYVRNKTSRYSFKQFSRNGISLNVDNPEVYMRTVQRHQRNPQKGMKIPLFALSEVASYLLPTKRTEGVTEPSKAMGKLMLTCAVGFFLVGENTVHQDFFAARPRPFPADKTAPPAKSKKTRVASDSDLSMLCSSDVESRVYDSSRRSSVSSSSSTQSETVSELMRQYHANQPSSGRRRVSSSSTSSGSRTGRSPRSSSADSGQCETMSARHRRLIREMQSRGAADSSSTSSRRSSRSSSAASGGCETMSARHRRLIREMQSRGAANDSSASASSPSRRSSRSASSHRASHRSASTSTNGSAACETMSDRHRRLILEMQSRGAAGGSSSSLSTSSRSPSPSSSSVSFVAEPSRECAPVRGSVDHDSAANDDDTTERSSVDKNDDTHAHGQTVEVDAAGTTDDDEEAAVSETVGQMAAKEDRESETATSTTAAPSAGAPAEPTMDAVLSTAARVAKKVADKVHVVVKQVQRPREPQPEQPPYVDYTARVRGGAFQAHLPVSGVVRLTRVEWDCIASFSHADSILALRSVSRQFYRAASDPRIWKHLLVRDMPRTTTCQSQQFKYWYTQQLDAALIRDEDTEEDAWQKCIVPTGTHVGRERCLREEYGALRFALCRVFLVGANPIGLAFGTRPDPEKRLRPLLFFRRGHPDDNPRNMIDWQIKIAAGAREMKDAALAKAGWAEELQQWLRIAPTDRRDAAALHEFNFTFNAVSAGTHHAATSLIYTGIVAVLSWVVAALSTAYTIYAFDKLSAIDLFKGIPFTPLEIPLDIQTAFDLIAVQSVPASLRNPLLLTAGGLVALSAVQVSQKMPKARRAALTSSPMMQYRVLMYAGHRALALCNETILSGVAGSIFEHPSLIVGLSIVPLLFSWSLGLDSAKDEAQRARREIQKPRKLEMIEVARARGDDDFDIELKDVLLTTEESTRINKKEKMMRMKATAYRAGILVAISIAAWKAKDATELFHSAAMALPLPQRVNETIAAMPTGNFAWSVMWTVLMAGLRGITTGSADSPAKKVHHIGLPTPFAPEAFPETPKEYAARLAADEAEYEKHETKQRAFLFVDEVIGTVAELSMRAAGCPAWLGVTFRSAVAAVQSVTEMYVARVTTA